MYKNYLQAWRIIMLAKKPPMGWNSWNTFGQNINEALIKETADAMVESGLKDAGYEYIVIDDCWSLRRRGADGRIVPDPEKFPSGMKSLSDYIHSKGLKFGMYSDAGTKTCAGYPGSFEHEFVDAETFAEWGVDYLKYDFCNKPKLQDGPILYNRISMALKATGRDILLSACNWGSDHVETWIRSHGADMYRSTGDIWDNFDSVRRIARSQMDKIAYSAPGCYNDMDMLICGMYSHGNVGGGEHGGCTDIEYRTHFALWCLYQSPLMIGCDIRKMNDATKSLLTNPELLAINQDEDARPPIFFIGNSESNVVGMLKHLSNGEYVFAFVNYSDHDAYASCELYDIGLSAYAGYGFELTDIFTKEESGPYCDYFPAYRIAPHDIKILRARLVKMH